MYTNIVMFYFYEQKMSTLLTEAIIFLLLFNTFTKNALMFILIYKFNMEESVNFWQVGDVLLHQ